MCVRSSAWMTSRCVRQPGFRPADRPNNARLRRCCCKSNRTCDLAGGVFAMLPAWVARLPGPPLLMQSLAADGTDLLECLVRCHVWPRCSCRRRLLRADDVGGGVNVYGGGVDARRNTSDQGCLPGGDARGVRGQGSGSTAATTRRPADGALNRENLITVLIAGRNPGVTVSCFPWTCRSSVTPASEGSRRTAAGAGPTPCGSAGCPATRPCARIDQGPGRRCVACGGSPHSWHGR